MELTKIPLAETRGFSPFFLDYIQQKDSLKPFYNRFPEIKNFKEQINDKGASFPVSNREILASVLEQQYKGLTITEAVKRNILSLRDAKTFTITTGHQLNVFTGPLYFIYKIITVINTSRKLKAQFPEYNFVPVYWMASEDHDYDEIKSFRLYGKKYVWETKQKGAVGRFHTKDFEILLKDVPGDVSIFSEAYRKQNTLAAAARHYVNHLFGESGLVVLDPDNAELKALFKNVIHEDVIRCSTLAQVNVTNSELEELNYKTQVFCREINFFYLDGNLRNRIEKQNDVYAVVETPLQFSEKQMVEMIDSQPQKFSPNVILRPLYEEIILPNLAYVGGPAEVIYWLQLKRVFDHYKVPFPIIMPRNFAMIMDGPLARKFEKTGLELNHLFEEKNFLFNHWVLKNSSHNLTIGSERNTLSGIFEELKRRAESIDETLGPFVGAEGKRILNSLEKIERKMLRAEKRRQSDKVSQIAFVKDALFPNGSLQERTDNFLNFYQQDKDIIRKLIDNFDPFDFQFNVFRYTA